MALSKLAVKRLTKLADFMERLPNSARKHFDMGRWFHHAGNHDHGIMARKPITRNDLGHCGTTACAFGWAATIPAFRKAGLSVNGNGTPNMLPHEFFEGASELFFAFGIRTPKQWAARCRKFIKANAGE